uniref:Glycosyltransferase 2-like domain-containing protein n=1 Tax=Pseudo-nitzschia australis TaxID=44445 RepID=A0A7S4EHD7_9STRA|mmetsp:Transcript_24097/g.50871  ORF Transcript_24097/g.50871 Transcript_24097/m.50871 type:complete len:334 (+) Transcript_24097:125-1126(+)
MKQSTCISPVRLMFVILTFAFTLSVIILSAFLPSGSQYWANNDSDLLRMRAPRDMGTASTKDNVDQPRLIVVAPTFYSDTSETRYLLGLEACQKAAEYGVEFILVDASPSQNIRNGLEHAGRSGDGRSFVRVVRQSYKGKKGAALREAIAYAVDELREENNKKTTMIGFQELEKVDVIKYWNSIAKHAMESKAGIVVPRREDLHFRASYPIEQYHSEQFGNMYLDSLGKKIGLPSIDWLNGPVAFDVSLANAWLEFDGELWDAQIVPMVDCFLKRNTKITSFDIPYIHRRTMKEQEEGNLAFIEKRLYQLNFLSDTVGKQIREAAGSVVSQYE